MVFDSALVVESLMPLIVLEHCIDGEVSVAVAALDVGVVPYFATRDKYFSFDQNGTSNYRHKGKT